MLRAAGEPTRLRVLVALERFDLTVSELCRVLDQSQPRVSRHLKLLSEAGLIVRRTEGTSAFFSATASEPARGLVQTMLDTVDPDDPTLERDRSRLDDVAVVRASRAAQYFETIAPEWDRIRRLHMAEDIVEQAIVDHVATAEIGTLIDIGTGTGRVLELVAPYIDHGHGVDTSREMLAIARSRLDKPELRHCHVRQGSVYDLDFEPDSADMAIVHLVLHYLEDPATAIAQAARVLRPDGLLVVVDFAPHDRSELRTEMAHRHLGIDDADLRQWCGHAGLTEITTRPLNTPTARRPLVATMWTAARATASAERTTKGS